MPRPTGPVIVRHPDADVMVVLDPGTDYAEGDVLVKTYAWAFLPGAARPTVLDSVSIEQATAAPGEKRNVRSR